MMWRRRKSIVNPRQQMWFGLEVVVIAIAFNVLCGFLLFIPPMSDLWGDPGQTARVYRSLTEVVLLKWPLVMLALLVMWAFGVLMSNRLAGPLIGLERVLRAWRAGDRTARVRFRKYDYLLPVKDSLNATLDQQEALLKQAGELADGIEKASSDPAVRAKVTELKSLLGPKANS
ncbi:MAG: methyl-accepting chemotaxis protein [Pseudomonadota bacterium]